MRPSFAIEVSLDVSIRYRGVAHADIVHSMEATYLVLLIATFLAIGVLALYILSKLFAGQR
jgi:hypothetical protein